MFPHRIADRCRSLVRRTHRASASIDPATELRRLNRAHRALSRCNHALIRSVDEVELLREVCRVVVEEAGYRFCWVGRAEHDADKTVRPIAKAGHDLGYLDQARIRWADAERGRGPTGTCIRERRPIVAKDVKTDPLYGPWREPALARGYGSNLAIPMFFDPETVWVMSIYASEAGAFDQDELALLCELADDLSYGITSLRTRAERNKAQDELRTLNAELERRVAARTQELHNAHQREAETGCTIQQALLLDEPPHEIRGLSVAALTVPSQDVAGDFYGFFRHETHDCLDVIVADVMGTGVPAALLGAAAKSHFPEALWHSLAKSRNGALPEPREIVALAHTHMAGQLIRLESFVTACYVRFDLAERTLEFVDCGHTGVIHVNPVKNRCAILHGDNLPLGVREGELFDSKRVPLDENDLVVLFSDGVTEARNAEGELFGVERLLGCVLKNASAHPASLIEAIREAVRVFSGRKTPIDDLTCVALRLEPHEPPRSRARLELRSSLAALGSLRDFVHEFCRELDPPLAKPAIAGLVLAVNEAASNIMKHAYHGRDDQPIELKLEAFSDRVSARLRHVGAPFDPTRVPPPSFDGSKRSGFGVFLIENSVDNVRYYRDDLARHCVDLEQRR